MTFNNQSPSAVVMIRPHHFLPNPQTAADNSFQTSVGPNNDLTQLAFQQVTDVAGALQKKGINVHLFEDESTHTPDSVFPNNWFSTHAEGKICLYPMFPENRRLERRMDIIEFINEHYQSNQVIDFSPYEKQNLFLEGTGAMVIDHNARVAYAVCSNRCNDQLFFEYCQQLSYRPVLFNATDKNEVNVYHTNVIMGIGNDYVIISDEMIRDKEQRERVLSQLKHSGKEIISVSEEQIEQYCGNVLELNGHNTKYLAISTTAFEALTPQQIQTLSKYVTLLPLDVTAIEQAGGSIRCMLAGIHLPRRKQAIEPN